MANFNYEILLDVKNFIVKNKIKFRVIFLADDD